MSGNDEKPAAVYSEGSFISNRGRLQAKGNCSALVAKNSIVDNSGEIRAEDSSENSLYVENLYADPNTRA
jgi:hypothetical protein